jgi:hypothetical protein
VGCNRLPPVVRQAFYQGVPCCSEAMSSQAPKFGKRFDAGLAHDHGAVIFNGALPDPLPRWQRARSSPFAMEAQRFPYRQSLEQFCARQVD